MSDLLAAIRAEGEAADMLTRACARQGALVDSVANDNPFTVALKKSFRKASVTPSDMLHMLSRVK
jgi:hypothetical protein